jgi:hypothetical protein
MCLISLLRQFKGDEQPSPRACIPCDPRRVVHSGVARCHIAFGLCPPYLRFVFGEYHLFFAQLTKSPGLRGRQLCHRDSSGSDEQRAGGRAQGDCEAQKIVGIWNARRPAAEPCGSIQRRAITSKLPARQHTANFSSPDDRHRFGNLASVPGRRTEGRWRLFTIPCNRRASLDDR